ncbi:hypothetical protein [Lactiplantibacillus pentosus]
MADERPPILVQLTIDYLVAGFSGKLLKSAYDDLLSLKTCPI